MYRPRMLAGPLAEALADTPVVVVAGPRQAGKSTLAEHVVAGRAGTWLTLDDATILDTARADPVGFVSGRSGLVGIDEAQRVPGLLLAVKAEVDRELPRLLRLVASRTSGELNITDLARDLGLSRPTTDSYLAHLEAVFLIQTKPPASTMPTRDRQFEPSRTLTTPSWGNCPARVNPPTPMLTKRCRNWVIVHV